MHIKWNLESEGTSVKLNIISMQMEEIFEKLIKEQRNLKDVFCCLSIAALIIHYTNALSLIILLFRKTIIVEDKT